MRRRAVRLTLAGAALVVLAVGAAYVRMRFATEPPADPTTQAVREEAARAEQIQREAQRLVADAQRAVRADPQNPVRYFELAQAYAAAQDPEGAITSLRRALDLDPRYFDAHLVLSQFYQELEYYDRALEHLERVLEINPESPGALLAMARLFFQFADGYAPMPYLERAARAAPQSAEVQMDLSMAYYLQSDLKAAQEHLVRAVELAPDNLLALQRLGVLYYNTNQFHLAREALQRVMQASREPAQQVDARKTMAKIELRDPEGTPEGAMGWLQQLAQAGYTDPETEYLSGEAFRALGNAEQAIHHYEHAVGTGTPFPDAYRPLAELYREAGRTDDADRLAGKMQESQAASTELRQLSARIARSPRDPDLWIRLGRQLRDLHLDGHAIFYLRRGLLFNPGHRGLHAALADAYEAVGRGADAQAEREQAAAR